MIATNGLRVAVACVLVSVACGGCGLSAATAITTAAGASPAVVQQIGSGESDVYWIAAFGDVDKAVRRAGNRLTLSIEAEEANDAGDRRYAFADARGGEIEVIVERRTETVTRARFDIDWQDIDGFVELFVQQIAQELEEADAFLVDWSHRREG